MNVISGAAAEARRGLEASDRGYLRFWKRDELNARAAEESLTRLEQTDLSVVARMALDVGAALDQDPEARLAAYRQALEAASQGAVSGAAPLAGLALGLLQHVTNPAPPEVAGKLLDHLQDFYPEEGSVRRLAPLAEAGARPEVVLALLRSEPRTPAAWAQGLGRASHPRNSLAFCQEAVALLQRSVTQSGDQLGQAWLDRIAAADALDLSPEGRVRVLLQAISKIGNSTALDDRRAWVRSLRLESGDSEKLYTWDREIRSKDALGQLQARARAPLTGPLALDIWRRLKPGTEEQISFAIKAAGILDSGAPQAGAGVTLLERLEPEVAGNLASGYLEKLAEAGDQAAGSTLPLLRSSGDSMDLLRLVANQPEEPGSRAQRLLEAAPAAGVGYYAEAARHLKPLALGQGDLETLGWTERLSRLTEAGLSEQATRFLAREALGEIAASRPTESLTDWAERLARNKQMPEPDIPRVARWALQGQPAWTEQLDRLERAGFPSPRASLAVLKEAGEQFHARPLLRLADDLLDDDNARSVMGFLLESGEFSEEARQPLMFLASLGQTESPPTGWQAALRDGLKLLEEGAPLDDRGWARLGTAMAECLEEPGHQRTMLQGALEAVECQLDPGRGETLRALREAAAEAAEPEDLHYTLLHALGEGFESDFIGVLDLGIRLVEARPEWQAGLEAALARAEVLAVQAGDRGLVARALSEGRSKVNGTNSPQQRLGYLRETHERLVELSQDLIYQATSGSGPALEIEKSEHYVEIGGVRVARRGAPEATEAPRSAVPAQPQPSIPAGETPKIDFGSILPALNWNPEPGSGQTLGEKRARKANSLARELKGYYPGAGHAAYALATAVAGSEGRGRWAAQTGKELDRSGYGMEISTAYIQVAALAGNQQAALEACKRGREFDRNYGQRSRAMFSAAAAVAGDEAQAREAYRIGQTLGERSYNREAKALYTLAGAIAGSLEKASQARTLAREFTGYYGEDVKAVFTVACAIAGNEERARRAYALGKQAAGYYGTETASLFTLAAAIAGDDRRAEKAFELGKEFSGYYTGNIRATFALAAAAALNPARGRFTPVLPGDLLFKKKDDD